MEIRITHHGQLDRDTTSLQHALMLLLQLASPREVADILWTARNAMKHGELTGEGRRLTAAEVIRGIQRECGLVNSPPSPGRPSKVKAWLEQLRLAQTVEVRQVLADPAGRVLAAAERDLSRTSFWRLRRLAAEEGLLGED